MKGYSCNFILQETKIFDKNCTQENVKCHIQHQESDLEDSKLSR